MKIVMNKCDRCGKEYDDLYGHYPIYIACRVVQDIPVQLDLCDDCLAILANFIENYGGKKDA